MGWQIPLLYSRLAQPAQGPPQCCQSEAECDHSGANDPHLPAGAEATGFWAALLSRETGTGPLCFGPGHCGWSVLGCWAGAGAGPWSLWSAEQAEHLCVARREPAWFGWPRTTTCSSPQGQGFSVCGPRDTYHFLWPGFSAPHAPAGALSTGIESETQMSGACLELLRAWGIPGTAGGAGGWALGAWGSLGAAVQTRQGAAVWGSGRPRGKAWEGMCGEFQATQAWVEGGRLCQGCRWAGPMWRASNTCRVWVRGQEPLPTPSPHCSGWCPRGPRRDFQVGP